MSAPSIRRTAFTVSNSGSPGPAPTSQTVPRGKSSGCIARLLGQNACERGATRPAVGARADRAADPRDIGEALVADRRDDRFQSEVEADADDRAVVGLCPPRAAGEQGRRDVGRSELRDQPVARGKLAGFSDEQCSDESARSEEHTSELQSLMRISYAVFCLQKK